jgi:hypothetical protein
LEWIQQTAAEILAAIMTEGKSDCEPAGREACTAAAA